MIPRSYPHWSTSPADGRALSFSSTGSDSTWADLGMEESTPARTSIDNGPQILDRSPELDRSKRRLWSSLPLSPTPLPPPAPLEEVPSFEGPLKIVTRLDTARELEEFGAFNLEIVQQSFRNEEKVRQPNEFYCPVKGCCRRYGNRNDLKHHVKRKHPDYEHVMDRLITPRSTKIGKAFPCPVRNCTCGYQRRRDLRRHLHEKHGEEKEVISQFEAQKDEMKDSEEKTD